MSPHKRWTKLKIDQHWSTAWTGSNFLKVDRRSYPPRQVQPPEATKFGQDIAFDLSYRRRGKTRNICIWFYILLFVMEVHSNARTIGSYRIPLIQSISLRLATHFDFFAYLQFTRACLDTDINRILINFYFAWRSTESAPGQIVHDCAHIVRAYPQVGRF
jgi:hypothetical protein